MVFAFSSTIPIAAGLEIENAVIAFAEDSGCPLTPFPPPPPLLPVQLLTNKHRKLAKTSPPENLKKVFMSVPPNFLLFWPDKNTIPIIINNLPFCTRQTATALVQTIAAFVIEGNTFVGGYPEHTHNAGDCPYPERGIFRGCVKNTTQGDIALWFSFDRFLNEVK